MWNPFRKKPISPLAQAIKDKLENDVENWKFSDYVLVHTSGTKLWIGDGRSWFCINVSNDIHRNIELLTWKEKNMLYKASLDCKRKIIERDLTD